MEDMTLLEATIAQYLEIKSMRDFIKKFTNILTEDVSSTDLIVSLIILKEQLPYFYYLSEDSIEISKAINAVINGKISAKDQLECNVEYLYDLENTLSIFNRDVIENFLNSPND